jgi:aryl-alcohol dehydrogenase-like predicted oxidoreductase
MEVRELGATGLRVSRLGLGLAALGRPGNVNLGHGQDLAGATTPEALEGRTFVVREAAAGAGIRYLDAARSYGRAEAFLAAWLAARHVAPDAVTIGTKWGYTYTAGWRVNAEQHEVKSHDLATLRRQWAETSALLGGRVDLLQVHSATLDSGVLDAVDVLDALAGLRAAGAVKAIGLTLSGPGQAAALERAMAVERDGWRLFDVVQATWNVLEPSLDGPLAAAGAAGMGVIVKEALANGRLVRGPEAAPLRAVAARLASTPDAVALAAALDRPWAHVVLSGAATVDQLRSNAGAAELSLDAAARATLAALAMPVEAYWRSRVELPWT